MALHCNARETAKAKARVREQGKEGEIVFMGIGKKGEGKTERDNDKPPLPSIIDRCLGYTFVPKYTSAT